MEMLSPIYAGVDILRVSGRLRRCFVYAALDADRELLALCHGDQDEVLAYFGGQAAAFVAINAPRAALVAAAGNTDSQQRSLPGNPTCPSHPMRMCEQRLQAEGFKLAPTPRSVGDGPIWMGNGFSLYQHLEAFGYRTTAGDDSVHVLLETHAEAVFWRLLKQKYPLPNSLEGRLQRQLILGSLEMPVPDAMDFFLEITRYKLMQGDLPDQDIHTYEELNALAAAYVAWQAAHHPEQMEWLGDPIEGQMVLPALP
jgi:hypothetical protein